LTGDDFGALPSFATEVLEYSDGPEGHDVNGSSVSGTIELSSLTGDDFGALPSNVASGLRVELSKLVAHIYQIDYSMVEVGFGGSVSSGYAEFDIAAPLADAMPMDPTTFKTWTDECRTALETVSDDVVRFLFNGTIGNEKRYSRFNISSIAAFGYMPTLHPLATASLFV